MRHVRLRAQGPTREARTAGYGANGPPDSAALRLQLSPRQLPDCSDRHRPEPRFPHLLSRSYSRDEGTFVVFVFYRVTVGYYKEKAFRAVRNTLHEATLDHGAGASVAAGAAVFAMRLPVLVVNDATGAQHRGALQLPRLAPPLSISPTDAGIRSTRYRL